MLWKIHTWSYHIISYHIISYHILSYHIISYHIIYAWIMYIIHNYSQLYTHVITCVYTIWSPIPSTELTAASSVEHPGAGSRRSSLRSHSSSWRLRQQWPAAERKSRRSPPAEASMVGPRVQGTPKKAELNVVGVSKFICLALKPIESHVFLRECHILGKPPI